MSASIRRPFVFISILSTIGSLGGFASTVSAQQTAMDEVVVTAGRIEESTRDVTSNISVINSDEIRQSPSRTLGELLAEKGLSHIQSYPGSLTSVGIRGFRTDTMGNDLEGHVLILLDGRRAGTGNAAKLLTKNIERIEIIRGPGAVQYGSAGMGGVVNIITRQGSANSAFVESGAGSGGRVEGSFGGTALADGFDFSGAVTTATKGDYDIGGGKTYPNTCVDNASSVSLNGGYSFSENQRIGMILTGFNGDGIGSSGYFSRPDLDDETDKSNYSLDTRYTGATGDSRLQWMTRYYFGQDKNSWRFPVASNPDGYDHGTSSRNSSDQQGAQAQLSGQLGVMTLTGGIDFVDYQVENSWSPEETSYDNPAVFLLSKSKFLEDKLILTGGLRYDWFQVEVEEPAGRNEEQEHLTPQLGLAYHLTDGLKIRGQYAQGFKIPSADELAIDTVNYGVKVVGNSDLDPEKSATYEGGLDYSRYNIKASLSYFYTSYEDKIVTEYLSDGSQSWANLGDATIAGIEFELNYDLGGALQWAWEVRPYLSGTILSQYEDEETGGDMLYTSGRNISGGLVIGNGQTFFCRFNTTYYSEQDVEDWQSATYPAPIVTLDPVTVAGLVASWKFVETEHYGDLTVRGEISNLFDEDYSYVQGYPMPGQTFFVSLRWDY